MSFNHMSTDSVIRRLVGLTDGEWNELCSSVERQIVVDRTQTSVLLSFIKTINTMAENNETFKTLANLLAINESTQNENIGHIAQRFFREFCPERVRNAFQHMGIMLAYLHYDFKGKRFLWIYERTVIVEDDSLELVAENQVSTGMLFINIKGSTEIEKIYLEQSGNGFLYFDSAKDGSEFANKAFKVRKVIRSHNNMK